MRIELGATVKTKDGHRAGKVTKAIWDPASNEVTEFLVSTGGLLGHDVLISRDVLERATPDGRELVIDLTKRELEALEHYDEHDFAPPPYGWLVPAVYSYEASAFLVPVATMPRPQPTAGATEERRRPAIRKGMAVKDAGGRKIGVVDELRIDDMTGELRAIVVRQGGPIAAALERDAGTREIPADHLDIGDDEVHVIEEVPGSHIGRGDSAERR
jgi:sporulation protein YlmC with PRC-barrel domain